MAFGAQRQRQELRERLTEMTGQRGRWHGASNYVDWACFSTASSTLPPAMTGFAPTSTKAMTQGVVPLFTQLWMVPRCTSKSPALRCTLLPSSSMSISPEITVA